MAPDRGRDDAAGTSPDADRGQDPAAETALTRAILGEEPDHTALDVAAETGVSIEDARRLWRALGFPTPASESEIAFTSADIEATGTLFAVVDSGAIDFDTAVNLTRALGQTMARLADWEVATLASRVEEMESGDEATGSRRGSAIRLVHEVNEPFERLLVYAWRRHLAAAVSRVEALGADDADLHTTQVTVGFADIVSFTQLSNKIDRVNIGDLVELFESRCADVVANEGGRVIKTIGDSVLFVNTDPAAAIATAEGIVEVVGRDSRMPDVRLGLATGRVVTRLGDVFGPPVNMAARLTTVARRNRIIIDQDTADQLSPDVFEARPMPARPVHGFGLVEPLTVRRR